MDFEWDSRKAQANRDKHGISFEEAIGVFSGMDTVLLDATRDVDGEQRSKVIGLIGGRLFVVVFTRRGAATRIISARRANQNEERAFGHGENQT